MKRSGGAKFLADAAKLNKRTHQLLLIELRLSARFILFAAGCSRFGMRSVEIGRLQNGEMKNGKQLLGIGPDPGQAEAG
jgi:hypothetical protein